MNPSTPFAANPMGDKRIPPSGNAPIMGQAGAFPSMMFPPGMPSMGGMGGMPVMGGMAGMPSMGGMPGMGGAMAGMPPGMSMGMGGMGGMSMSMGGMPSMGGFPMGGMPMSQFGRGGRFSVKETEFEKGLFVEDFEESVTGEMLYKHFNDIKPVSIIKFPTDVKRHSKKFAFVYFRTPEDARLVKAEVEAAEEAEEKAIANKATPAELAKLSKCHRILKKVCKVSCLAVNRQSKLMLKPRDGGSASYFTAKNIEREIKRVLAPTADLKLNKVVVPKNPKDASKDLDYARVFFDLKQLNHIDDIKELLEKDDAFNKNVEIIPFNPPPKFSNMLYINNFVKKGESAKGIMELEIKDFFQKLNPAWVIQSVWLQDHDMGAWGYITFETKEFCKEAHETLKTDKPKFHGNRLYGNIKNETDPRAVIIYNLKSSITQDQITEFFERVALNSKKTVLPAPPAEGEDPKPHEPEERRIFDFYNVCIVEPKKFVHNFTHEPIEVPRRVVISFVDPVEKPERLLELGGEIEALPDYKNYFDSDGIRVLSLKYSAQPYRLMGHIEDKASQPSSRHVKHGYSDKRDKFDKERKGQADRGDRKNFQQKRPPIKTGYTPIMNVRIPGRGGFAGAPGMGGRPMGRPNNLPYSGTLPSNLAPTGMSYMGGRPPIKPSATAPTGMVGMPMPSNMNPLSQMSHAAGMRPPQMGQMSGSSMGMNPMMPPPVMGGKIGGSMMGGPMMGGPMMGGPMMGNPPRQFAPPNMPDKKPAAEPVKNDK